MKLLVVDDDALASEMIAAVLESVGHEVVRAEHALQALEVLTEQPDIDGLVSDMNMPLMSGIELFQELKAAGSTRPFILLTGDEPEGLLAQEPSLNACIRKDFSMDETLPVAINLAFGGEQA